MKDAATAVSPAATNRYRTSSQQRIRPISGFLAFRHYAADWDKLS
jgi:hypothetical protein